jgi:hypothetical protein
MKFTALRLHLQDFPNILKYQSSLETYPLLHSTSQLMALRVISLGCKAMSGLGATADIGRHYGLDGSVAFYPRRAFVPKFIVWHARPAPRNNESSIVALAHLSAFFRWPLLPAQIKRAVNDADVTIGLWKIPQHTPG